MTKTWARTNLSTSTVTLADSLKDDPTRLDQVLCHELAHVVAYGLVGRAEGPHGPTWQALVRVAGHDPVLRLRAADVSVAAAEDIAHRFLHRCLVCDFSRSALRRMRAWRCADCVAAGLAGDLVIVEQRIER